MHKLKITVKFTRPPLLPWIVLLLLGFVPMIGVWTAGAQERPFIHPGGAYKLTPPAGWERHAFIDDGGWPFYVFSPDSGRDPQDFSRGIWVTAYPVPTDDDLAKDDVSVLANQLLRVEEPGLVASLDNETQRQLGKLPAKVLSVTGQRAGKPWRGQMRIAVQEDNFLVVRYGCPAEQWDQLLPTFDQVVSTLQSPVPLGVRGVQPVPDRPQISRDLAENLSGSLPLIDVMMKPVKNDKEAAHGNADADALGELAAWGSGFIVTNDGYMITNRHVVHGEASPDGRLARDSYDLVEVAWDQSLHRQKNRAKVVAVSYVNDLALLKLIGHEGEHWPAMPLAEMSKARRGDNVMVCGWPDPQELGERDLNFNNGTLNTIEHDQRGRPIGIRHSAITTAGNSGGPLYDLNLGGIIGVHSRGIIVHTHDLTQVLYDGAVPIDRVVWEFPQLLGDMGTAPLDKSERDALIAYYFLQKRFGAAIFECQRALEDNPRDGIANTFKYRMAAMQASPVLQGHSLEIALADPRSQFLATLFAAQSLMEQDQVKEAEVKARQAVEKAPQNIQARLLLGLAQMGMGHFDESQQSLQQAFDLSHGLAPDVEDWLGYLPLLRWTVENDVVKMPWSTTPPPAVTLDAVKHLQHSYKLWPSRNWFALANFGIIQGFAGHADEATDLILSAKQSAPEDPDLQLALAYYMCVNGKGKTAMAFASQAIEAHETPRGHCILAWAFFLMADEMNRSGDSQQALAFAKMGFIHEVIAVKGAPDAFWTPAALKTIEQVKPMLQSAAK
jgi:S1-C subfamily serine protease/Flp pilus assembly protein TadD